MSLKDPCPACDGDSYLPTSPDEYGLPRVIVCHTCAGSGTADGPVDVPPMPDQGGDAA